MDRGKLTKHVVINGSREHVVYWVRNWNGVVRHCSCPSCEINHDAGPRSQCQEENPGKSCRIVWEPSP